MQKTAEEIAEGYRLVRDAFRPIAASMLLEEPRLRKLHAIGTRFVLLEGGQGPKSSRIPGWHTKDRVTVAEVMTELARGRLVGYQPASVGLQGFDVDYGGRTTVAYLEGALGKAAAVIPTLKPNRFHCLWPCKPEEERKGGNWYAPGIEGRAGEFRCAGGSYLCLYDARSVLEAVEAAKGMEPVDPPSYLFQKPNAAVPAKQAAPAKTKAAPTKASKDEKVTTKKWPKWSWTPGTRNDVFHKGVHRYAILDQPEEAKAFMASCVDSGYGGGEKAALKVFRSSWDAGERLRNSALSKDPVGLQAALEAMGWRVRRNIRSQRDQWSLDEAEWTDLDDLNVAKLRGDIGLTFQYKVKSGALAPLYFGQEAWSLALNYMLYSRQVDPFIEWLESLEPWDKVRRLDSWCFDLFVGGNHPKDPLLEWASRTTILGVIQRAYDPGSKLDEIPIFTGDQGIGKSSAIRELLPPARQRDWFSDAVNLAAASKEQLEGLQGCVVVELSELAGMRRAEIEGLKSFITRQTDIGRKAYRRDSAEYPRRCCFVGTSNVVESLPNEVGGNRRFVPVVLERGGDVEAYMAEHRTQLWAEGLARYKAGERGNLPRDLHAAQQERAEVHRSKDEVLADRIEWLRQEDINGEILINLMKRSGLVLEGAPSKSVQGTFTAELRACGWKRSQVMVHGQRSYRWLHDLGVTEEPL